MSSYTITITPDDQSHAVSTVRVEVSPNGTRITELVIRAGDAEGLTPHQFPPVDLELLLRAVNPPARPTATASTTVVASAPGTVPAAAFSGAADVTTPPAKIVRPRTAAATVAPFTVPTAKPTPATDTPAVTTPRNGATSRPAPAAAAASRPEPAANAKATAQPATAQPATAQPAAAAKDAAEQPAPAARAATKRAAVRPTTTRTATTRSTTTARSTTARPAAAVKRAKADADTTDGGRSYRRAPADLAEVYRQARSAAGIADHYSVPRHTANNWIRTLKKNNPDT